ncbi:MAG: hypothetical protein AABW99_01825 [archaeon]
MKKSAAILLTLIVFSSLAFSVQQLTVSASNSVWDNLVPKNKDFKFEIAGQNEFAKGTLGKVSFNYDYSKLSSAPVHAIIYLEKKGATTIQIYNNLSAETSKSGLEIDLSKIQNLGEGTYAARMSVDIAGKASGVNADKKIIISASGTTVNPSSINCNSIMECLAVADIQLASNLLGKKKILIDTTTGGTTSGTTTGTGSTGLGTTATGSTGSGTTGSGTTPGTTPGTASLIWKEGITATVFSDIVTATGRSCASGFCVALPSTSATNRTVEVCNSTKCATSKVLDVGPWCVRDDEYVFGSSTPFAEKNKGSYLDDLSGNPECVSIYAGTRYKSNGAGIDLSTDLANQLGINGLGTVKWRFT